MAKKNNAKDGRGKAGDGRIQTFSFTGPAAMSVQVVGDFTHWQHEPTSMQKAADGIWRATVALTPGKHHYRFLVDGEWRDDPECTVRVPNAFGSQNCACQVG